MIGIFVGDQRIGTVAKFVGNPPSQRWYAWAVSAEPKKEGPKQGFPTRREAIRFLETCYDQHRCRETTP